MQLPEIAPLLTEVTLDGAFLISDHAFTMLIRGLNQPLTVTLT